MRYLEVRRHTMRIKPSKHICQAGVTLARRIGNEMGPFDRVVTSDLPRAFETSIAFGFAVDEQVPELSTMGDDVDDEINHEPDFAGLARAVRKAGAAARFARHQAKLWQSIVGGLPVNGHALIVAHGGVIELGAIGCLPDADHAAWGGALDYCEGVRLSYDGKAFVSIEVLRSA
jgi:broad specificity phosphatase PhoE